MTQPPPEQPPPPAAASPPPYPGPPGGGPSILAVSVTMLALLVGAGLGLLIPCLIALASWYASGIGVEILWGLLIGIPVVAIVAGPIAIAFHRTRPLGIVLLTMCGFYLIGTAGACFIAIAGIAG